MASKIPMARRNMWACSLRDIRTLSFGETTLNRESMAKSYAEQLLHTPASITLTLPQALEVAVSLTSPATSWEDFMAGSCTPMPPEAVGDYLARVCATQRRIASLGLMSELTSYERSYLAMEYLAILLNYPQQPLTALWDLLNDIDTGVTQRVREHELSCLLPSRLKKWFYNQYAQALPWQSMRPIALKLGIPPMDVATIFEAQRRTVSECWPLHAWFEVGVLDPNQNAFLSALRNQPNWSKYFLRLIARNGQATSQIFTR